MKKLLLSILLLSTFFISKSFAQAAGEPVEKKGWPSSERADFIRECIKTAKVNMGEDSARSYCYCMQEKVEKKYPTIEAAGKITSADMQSPGWQKDIKDCIASSGTWPTIERKAFITECVKSATAGGLTEDKAKSYCSCMLFKIEKKFPNAADAGSITEETLQTPEFKKMLKDCLEF